MRKPRKAEPAKPELEKDEYGRVDFTKIPELKHLVGLFWKQKKK